MQRPGERVPYLWMGSGRAVRGPPRHTEQTLQDMRTHTRAHTPLGGGVGKKQCSKEMRILVQRTSRAPTGVGCCEWFPLQLFAFLSCQRHSKDGFQGSFDSMTKSSPSCQSQGSTPLLFPDSRLRRPNPGPPPDHAGLLLPLPALPPPRSLAGPHPNKFGRQFWCSASSKVAEKLRGKQACAQA